MILAEYSFQVFKESLEKAARLVLDEFKPLYESILVGHALLD